MSSSKIFQNNFVIFILIFFISLLVYISNIYYDYNKDLVDKTHRNLLTTSDAAPNTFFAFNFFKYQTFDFSNISFYLRQFDGGSKNPYFLVTTENGKFSAYPVFTGIMSFPVFIVPLLLNKISSFDFYENIVKVLLLGRLTAAFYSSLSVAIFYLILRKVNDSINSSLLFTILFGFGTTMWSISSRSLWTHTIFVFFLVLILYILINKNIKTYQFILLGFLTSLGILTRSTFIYVALAFSIYIFFKYGKAVFLYILGAVPGTLLLLSYNYFIWGGFFSEGYGARGDLKWTTPLLEGMLGNIFMPGKGFLFITPILVLFFYLIYKVFKDKKFGDERNFLYKFFILIFILYFITYSKWYDWMAGNSFGYRFFTDILPIMLIPIYEFYCKFSSKKIRIIFYILVLYSVIIQFNSVYYNKSRCDDKDVYSANCLLPDTIVRSYLK